MFFRIFEDALVCTNWVRESCSGVRGDAVTTDVESAKTFVENYCKEDSQLRKGNFTDGY